MEVNRLIVNMEQADWLATMSAPSGSYDSCLDPETLNNAYGSISFAPQEDFQRSGSYPEPKQSKPPVILQRSVPAKIPESPEDRMEKEIHGLTEQLSALSLMLKGITNQGGQRQQYGSGQMQQPA